MTATDLVLIALVLAAMTAVAVTDARRALVDPRMVLALVGSGLLWRLFGPAETGPLWTGAAGAALGVLVAAVPIAIAQLRGRRWPLFPGDAMMLGGLGFVLGPLSLGWALLAGASLSLLYRAWFQRRRGRSFLRGYCPLGPGMAAGAMAVFVFVNAGGALAADGGAPWYGTTAPLPPAKPGALRDIRSDGNEASGQPGDVAAGRIDFLAATELGPLRVPLPSSLAVSEVAVDEAGPLPFAALTDRIATLAGVPVEVEERPARIVGGAVALPAPPAIRLTYEGRLPGLLNLVAARSGYDWSWDEGAIVFYRYRDRGAPWYRGTPWYVEHLAPEDALAAPIARAARTGGGDAAASKRGASPWIVDPARHGTLRAVLEDWGADAGWSVVWTPRRDYAVRADAVFEGDFLDAVDGVLSAPATRRALVALAYEPNRHLVIEPAGGVR